MKVTKSQARKAFNRLLTVARWALRKQYSEKDARDIEVCFGSDSAEIICIAARDLSNAIRKPAAKPGKENL